MASHATFTSNQADCRTIAIEVGMQNSGLAVALADEVLCLPLRRYQLPCLAYGITSRALRLLRPAGGDGLESRL